MIKSLDELNSEVTINRVANGWVVAPRVSNFRDCNIPSSLCVAKTPKELGDMIQDWAQRQTDLPNGGSSQVAIDR